MSDFLYRFRPLTRLIDQNELENQEIYFAPPASLNDPVEGYLDVYWFGDLIVWTNLLRHYLLCRMHCHLYVLIGGETSPLTSESIPVFWTTDNLPTIEYKQKYKKICSDFFAHVEIKAFIENLVKSGRKVRRNELSFYLTSLHPFALSIVAKTMGVGLSVISSENAEKLNNALKKLAEFPLKTSADPSDDDAAFEFGKIIEDLLALMRIYKNPSLSLQNNRRFLTSEFNEKYLERIQTLTYPPWYAACFSKNIENASVWGHYGEKHYGACLVFKDSKLENGKSGITLKGITGYHSQKGDTTPSKILGPKFMEFHEIHYDGKYPEIDFFKSIGRLTESALTNHWYSDSEKNISACAKGILDNMDGWREKFWQPFQKSNTTKLAEWGYEAEWRLLLSSSIDDLTNTEDRLLTYQFSDLHGIVFGMKTSFEQKIKIIKIIEKKCVATERDEFKFYQASYSHMNGKIKITELPPIKLILGG